MNALRLAPLGIVVAATVLIGAAPTPPRMPHHRRPRGEPKPPAVSQRESPHTSAADLEPRILSFEITEHGPSVPWVLTIRNPGERPVTVTADPRLLWFEVQVPGKQKDHVCQLPSELFPAASKPEHDVLLQPRERLTSSFDPRFYCFEADGQSSLVPGAVVKPRFGWPEKTRTAWRKGRRMEVLAEQSPPYVARMVTSDSEGTNSADSKSATSGSHGLKLLRGESVALSSSYATWAKSGLASDSAAPSEPLELTLAEGSDEDFELNTTVAVKLTNRSAQNRQVFIRRELLSFEVMTPDGLVPCDPGPDRRAPDPQEFVNLKPGGSFAMTSRLVELCPRGTFAQPGLYLVHGRFDSTQSGDEYDLEGFVGRIASREPVTLRIRKGSEKSQVVPLRHLRDAE